MADKYKSTDDQLRGELEAMHNKMRDPEEHQKKHLEVNQKKNVERTTRRYGLD